VVRASEAERKAKQQQNKIRFGFNLPSIIRERSQSTDSRGSTSQREVSTNNKPGTLTRRRSHSGSDTDDRARITRSTSTGSENSEMKRPKSSSSSSVVAPIKPATPAPAPAPPAPVEVVEEKSDLLSIFDQAAEGEDSFEAAPVEPQGRKRSSPSTSLAERFVETLPKEQTSPRRSSFMHEEDSAAVSDLWSFFNRAAEEEDSGYSSS
jgi:hypothetical protein